MKKTTGTLIALLTIAGTGFSDVLYENSFEGTPSTSIANNNLNRIAITNAAIIGGDLTHSAVSANLNGSGQLISTYGPGNGFRVELSSTPLTDSILKITWTVKSPATTNWIGVGFAGENINKLNDANANSGPWVYAGVNNVGKSVTVYNSGTAANAGGNVTNKVDSHTAGDLLTYELIFNQADQTIDLYMTGTNGLRTLIFDDFDVIHTDPLGNPAAPEVRFLSVQIWGDGSYLDYIKVEAIPEAATALFFAIGSIGVFFARRYVRK